MSNNKCCSKDSKCPSTPLSSHYSEEMNNKAHEKSPYGEAEPSTKTTYK